MFEFCGCGDEFVLKGTRFGAEDTNKSMTAEGEERPQKTGCILVCPLSFVSLQRAKMSKCSRNGTALGRRS